MSGLPEGWAEASLATMVISSLGGDWGKDCDERLNGYEKVRVVRGTDFKDWKTHRAARAAERCIKQSSLASRRLADGDIVVEVSGGGPTQPVGRTILIDKATLDNSPLPLVCSNFFRQVRLHELIDSAYVKHFLSHVYFKGQFDEFQTQTTNLRNLNFTKFLEGTRIDLPPINEQRRVVAKLEKLMSRVDAAQDRLAIIPRTLKRFRQSVLAAACSGRLTADWREEQEYLESAAALLQRLEIQGESKDLRVDGSRKKPISAQEDSSDFFDLPDSWAVTNFGSVVKSIRGGSTAVPENAQTDFPILRSSSVRPGWVDLKDVKYLSGEASQNNLNYLSEGDLLFTRLSGSLHYVANCAKVRGLNGRMVQYPDRLFCAKVIPPMNSSYCELVFAAPFVRSQVVEHAKSSAGHQRISVVNITDQSIPVAPLAEQQEIVRRVEALFKTADALEARYHTARTHVDKLTQSILAKAFRGELVPQDPSDESASILLERIRQERNGTEPKKRSRRK